MKKNTLTFLAASLLVFLFFGGVLQAQILNEDSYKFSKVLQYVSKYYVDTVNEEELVEEAIVAMLKELDPHSIYVSKEEVKEMNEPLEGNFEGIGVQFNILNDTILIINPIPGGPSEKLGIRAGDRIIKVEGENVAGIGINTKGVRKRLLGKKGTKVNVSIKRRGKDELLSFTIVRDKIPIFSLDASYMVNDRIGYIKLNRFAATSMKEYHRAFLELRMQGMRDLILDLRGNGGGYLQTAINLVDEFLEKGKMIVYTQGQNSPRNEHFSTSLGDFEKGRVVVLIDGGSASASEIVAGAIQDWDRGLIIGRRSFGKGLVQRPLHLNDGSMIRLTTARYYTPTGRLIQKPYENGVDEYREELINRYNTGELTNADSIHFPDSVKYFTLENKRLVFGGGGIMPDIFVPLDTSANSDFYAKLIQKSIISTFCLQYVDENRKTLLETYPDFQTYKQKFQVSEYLLEELLRYAEQEGLKRNTAEFETSKSEIKYLVKATIAADIWDVGQYFEIINTQNAIFSKAVQVLNDKRWHKNLLKN